MTTKDDERRRIQDARAKRAAASIIEDIAGRPFIGDEWAHADKKDQDEMRSTWEQIILAAIVSPLVLLVCFVGCSKPAPAKLLSDPARSKVMAADLLAYSRFAPREQPNPAPTPSPDDDAGMPTEAELAEYGAPEKLSWIERRIANSINTSIDEKLQKANLSWEEVRRMVATSERLRVWLDSFPAPKKQDAPAAESDPVNTKIRCLFFHGPNCEPCIRMQREWPKLKESGWKIGTAAASDIQDCDCDSPACLPIRMRYLPQGSSLPVCVLVLPNGDEAGRKVGYVEYRELAKWINDTRNAHPER